jgi:hypothetical protein
LADWLRRTVETKTPDFRWTTGDDQAWELKTPSSERWEAMTPKQQYARIARRISDDADAKKCFAVDIGDGALSDDLRWQLSQYNRRHEQTPGHRIDQLVVMSGGKLYPIVLA